MTSTWNCTLNAQINLQHKKLKTGQETNISNMSWKFVKKDMTIILTILLHFVSTNALLAITIIFILTGKVFCDIECKNFVFTASKLNSFNLQILAFQSTFSFDEGWWNFFILVAFYHLSWILLYTKSLVG